METSTLLNGRIPHVFADESPIITSPYKVTRTDISHFCRLIGDKNPHVFPSPNKTLSKKQVMPGAFIAALLNRFIWEVHEQKNVFPQDREFYEETIRRRNPCRVEVGDILTYKWQIISQEGKTVRWQIVVYNQKNQLVAEITWVIHYVRPRPH